MDTVNVRMSFLGQHHRSWCRDRGIPVEFFETFDGGGYNFHILEFQNIQDANAFMSHFGIEPSNGLITHVSNGSATR